MSVLSDYTLRRLGVSVVDNKVRHFVHSDPNVVQLHVVHPFVERAKHYATNTSFGLSMAGYDVRLDQEIDLGPIGMDNFQLASTLEYFTMPNNVIARVHDKSTWVRRKVTVQNTVIEPGWFGYLTIELINHSHDRIVIPRGAPIAQVVFEWLDHEAENPYSGGYQDQKRGPQPARPWRE